jgi:hypothetical protein
MKRLSMAVWLAATILAVSAIGSQSVAQVNLFVNPGFEASGGSYDGWGTFGEGVQLSLPGGDNIIRTGVAAAKIYGEFTGCPSNPQFDVGGFFQSFTPTPGLEYQMRGYTFVSVADTIPATEICVEQNRLIAKIVFFDAAVGGDELSPAGVRHGGGLRGRHLVL